MSVTSVVKTVARSGSSAGASVAAAITAARASGGGSARVLGDNSTFIVILSFVDLHAIAACGRVCRAWAHVASDWSSPLWRLSFGALKSTREKRSFERWEGGNGPFDWYGSSGDDQEWLCDRDHVRDYDGDESDVSDDDAPYLRRRARPPPAAGAAAAASSSSGSADGSRVVIDWKAKMRAFIECTPTRAQHAISAIDHDNDRLWSLPAHNCVHGANFSGWYEDLSSGMIDVAQYSREAKFVFEVVDKRMTLSARLKLLRAVLERSLPHSWPPAPDDPHRACWSLTARSLTALSDISAALPAGATRIPDPGVDLTTVQSGVRTTAIQRPYELGSTRTTDTASDFAATPFAGVPSPFRTADAKGPAAAAEVAPVPLLPDMTGHGAFPLLTDYHTSETEHVWGPFTGKDSFATAVTWDGAVLAHTKPGAGERFLLKAREAVTEAIASIDELLAELPPGDEMKQPPQPTIAKRHDKHKYETTDSGSGDDNRYTRSIPCKIALHRVHQSVGRAALSFPTRALSGYALALMTLITGHDRGFGREHRRPHDVAKRYRFELARSPRDDAVLSYLQIACGHTHNSVERVEPDFAIVVERAQIESRIQSLSQSGHTSGGAGAASASLSWLLHNALHILMRRAGVVRALPCACEALQTAMFEWLVSVITTAYQRDRSGSASTAPPAHGSLLYPRAGIVLTGAAASARRKDADLPSSDRAIKRLKADSSAASTAAAPAAASSAAERDSKAEVPTASPPPTPAAVIKSIGYEQIMFAMCMGSNTHRPLTIYTGRSVNNSGGGGNSAAAARNAYEYGNSTYELPSDAGTDSSGDDTGVDSDGEPLTPEDPAFDDAIAAFHAKAGPAAAGAVAAAAAAATASAATAAGTDLKVSQLKPKQSTTPSTSSSAAAAAATTTGPPPVTPWPHGLSRVTDAKNVNNKTIDSDEMADGDANAVDPLFASAEADEDAYDDADAAFPHTDYATREDFDTPMFPHAHHSVALTDFLALPSTGWKPPLFDGAREDVDPTNAAVHDRLPAPVTISAAAPACPIAAAYSRAMFCPLTNESDNDIELTFIDPTSTATTRVGSKTYPNDGSKTYVPAHANLRSEPRRLLGAIATELTSRTLRASRMPDHDSTSTVAAASAPAAASLESKLLALVSDSAYDRAVAAGRALSEKLRPTPAAAVPAAASSAAAGRDEKNALVPIAAATAVAAPAAAAAAATGSAMRDDDGDGGSGSSDEETDEFDDAVDDTTARQQLRAAIDSVLRVESLSDRAQHATNFARFELNASADAVIAVPSAPLPIASASSSSASSGSAEVGSDDEKLPAPIFLDFSPPAPAPVPAPKPAPSDAKVPFAQQRKKWAASDAAGARYEHFRRESMRLNGDDITRDPPKGYDREPNPGRDWQTSTYFDPAIGCCVCDLPTAIDAKAPSNAVARAKATRLGAQVYRFVDLQWNRFGAVVSTYATGSDSESESDLAHMYAQQAKKKRAAATAGAAAAAAAVKPVLSEEEQPSSDDEESKKAEGTKVRRLAEPRRVKYAGSESFMSQQECKFWQLNSQPAIPRIAFQLLVRRACETVCGIAKGAAAALPPALESLISDLDAIDALQTGAESVMVRMAEDSSLHSIHASRYYVVRADVLYARRIIQKPLPLERID